MRDEVRERWSERMVGGWRWLERGAGSSWTDGEKCEVYYWTPLMKESKHCRDQQVHIYSKRKSRDILPRIPIEIER